MKPEKNKKRTAIVISILLAAILVAAAAVYFYIQTRPTEAETLDELLALGEKYLLAEDYENALVAFEKAIEIDEKCVEAYVGAAEAYIGMDEPEKAVGILKLGYERTKSSAIQDMLLDLDGEEITVAIQQIDNSEFPKVSLYIAAKDEKGRAIRDLNVDNFAVEEKVKGEKYKGKIIEVEKVKEAEKIGVNLVLDQSGSMSDYEKIEQAKYAAKKFLDGVDFTKGDQVAVISFDDYVYQKQDFTGETTKLVSAIDSIQPTGQTAFYDALYTALLNTHGIDGAKSVIAYTDGIENGSRHTYQEIIELANKTGIPIFTIGIGEDCDDGVLEDIAVTMSGEYYSISDQEFGKSLRKIYDTIYREQTEWVKITYVSDYSSEETGEREITLTAKRGYKGEALREYTPKTELPAGFSGTIGTKDYIIPSSSTAALTQENLKNLRLSELVIARNEIYARHGRMFENAMLNLWFNSKGWYDDISPKYTPSEFDQLEPYPLSDIEIDNVQLIKEYENNLKNTGNVFPNSSTALLTELDVVLPEDLLERGLREIYEDQNTGYGNKAALNATQKKNVEMIEKALRQ